MNMEDPFGNQKQATPEEPAPASPAPDADTKQ